MNRLHLTFCCMVGLAMLAGGCRPEPIETGWSNPLTPLQATVVENPDDDNYVLTRMELGRAAVRNGSHCLAEPPLMEAFHQLEADKENTAAALSSERFKYYKGETYERAMLCWYLGYVNYCRGEYNNARILFTRAISEDGKAVVSEDTPSEVGDDFGLAYYWLGRAYDKLGQADNARIALKKATCITPRGKDGQKEQAADVKEAAKALERRVEGETWAYEKFREDMPGIVNVTPLCSATAETAPPLPTRSAGSPVVASAESCEEFFTPDIQRQANLVLTIELGACPAKVLAGRHKERVELVRPRVRPSSVQVFIDGHPAGEAFQVLDMWDQATTQDRIKEKEAAQIGKAIAKEVLVQLVGSAASYWDVSGDARYWTQLPGRVFAYAAKVTPGVHTVTLRMYDIDGRLLPRWTSTYYGIAAAEGEESLVLVNPHFDQDNALSGDRLVQALQEDAAPIEE